MKIFIFRGLQHVLRLMLTLKQVVVVSMLTSTRTGWGQAQEITEAYLKEARIHKETTWQTVRANALFTQPFANHGADKAYGSVVASQSHPDWAWPSGNVATADFRLRY